MLLLLFDIDGTLLSANGAGRTAVQSAISAVTGQSATTEGVPFSGRTDPDIFRDVLTTNGLSSAPDLLNTVMEAYAENARALLGSADVDRLAGTDALLSAIADHPDMHLGLVTGNIESIAYHKLQMAGLANHFSVGAFGSDHRERAKLPGLAVRRATAHTGHSFSMNNTLVIGDTRHDIECARAAGTRSMAVATGRFSRSELASHDPDLLFDNLENYAGVMQHVVDVLADDSIDSKSRHDL
jgi:phosphoglycolate phosphatase-like HAD superfamily hydrolase